MNAARWLDLPATFNTFAGARSARITVLRDDLIEGGSKLRFLPFLLSDAEEVVYGGPFCGAAAHALSVWAREEHRRCTLFYADRKDLHPRQLAAQANGAKLVMVKMGYMNVVQARARAYAKEAGALFLPLGFDVPAAIEPLSEFARRVRDKVGEPDQVWCASGSGMLARVLASTFTSSQVFAVAVSGLAERLNAAAFPSNVRLMRAEMPFAKKVRSSPPFPCDANYDAKAWQLCVRDASGSVLFWNVAGSTPPERATQ